MISVSKRDPVECAERRGKGSVMTKKKVYPPEFKAKIVRELVEGDDSVGVVAARHHLNAGMVARWRKQLFDDAAIVFAQEQELRKDRELQEKRDREVDNLNRIIGRLTVERDYLQRSLGEKLDELGL